MDSFEKPHGRLFIFILSIAFFFAFSTNDSPTEDVIGQYAVINEEQCRKLCWYHGPCKSYSYLRKNAACANKTPSNQNCFLYSKSDPDKDSDTKGDADWVKRPASGSRIQNGCSSRPCSDTNVCIPTSSASASYACLLAPAPPPPSQQCGSPPTVPNGHVDVRRSVHDVADVTCNARYVASPKNVSRTMVRSASGWTQFAGTCQQYEFVIPDGVQKAEYIFPWELEENSKFCLKGFLKSADLFVLFFKDSSVMNITVRLVFRYGNEVPLGVHWTFQIDDVWVINRKQLADMRPISIGDSFNITGRFLRDELQVVLNEAHTYKIPLKTLKLINGSQYDFRKIRIVGFKQAAYVTYANLIEGCN